MKLKNTLLIILAMTLADGALAQTLYKSIGSDGKVVYSDKPPIDDKTKVDVIGHTEPPAPVNTETPAPGIPAQSDTTAPQEPAPTAALPDSWLQAPKQAEQKESPHKASVSKINPELEKAILGVMGLEVLMQQSTELCISTLPTSFKKYSEASENWEKRNAEYIKQRKIAFADSFNSAQRSLLETGIKARNQKMMVPILNAPMASRIKWCDQSTDEINSGSQDIDKKQHLAAPLLNYRPKPG